MPHINTFQVSSCSAVLTMNHAEIHYTETSDTSNIFYHIWSGKGSDAMVLNETASAYYYDVIKLTTQAILFLYS